MEKILVTTDFSVNSKAGMRYAIQLAEARKAQLIFLHVHQVLRASFWTDDEYAYYVGQATETIIKDLPSFVKSVYRYMNVIPQNYQMVVHHNLDTVDGILEYAEKERVSYICISTRGAGTLKKIYGTNTGNLITNSNIPVLCIPHNYKIKPINHILYASDMTDYENELGKVVAFAKPLNATVEMLHLAYPYEFILDKELMEQTLEKKTNYQISLHYEKRDIDLSLMDEIKKAINKSKPSVLVMFTNQHRSFLDRILLSSDTKEYSFHAKIPLLSFNKKVGTDKK